jgi:hypothetical protein
MKNILKFGLLACLAAAFVFVGCKKDDNNKYTVTLSANNPDMGVVAGAGEYDEGAEIQIMATANSGYQFVKWSDEDTNNPRTITVNKTIALIAIFAEGNGGGGTNNGGGNNNSGNTGTETGDFLSSKVAKIVCKGDNKHSDKIYSFDSEGRLVSGYYDEKERQFQYTDNQILDKETQYPLFNIENGRITTAFDAWKNGVLKREYGYSPDGYLLSIKEVNDNEDHKFTYENEMLIKYRKEGDYEMTFTYGDKLNNLNVDVFYGVFIMPRVVKFNGFLGKKQKYLPESCVLVSEQSSSENSNYTFSYEYNGEYITKIEWKVGGVVEETYEIYY